MIETKKAWLLALAGATVLTMAGASLVACSESTQEDDQGGGDASADSTVVKDGSGGGGGDGATTDGGDAGNGCSGNLPFVPGAPKADAGVFCPFRPLDAGKYCGVSEQCCVYPQAAKVASQCVAIGSACPTLDAATPDNTFQCTVGETCAAADAGSVCCFEGSSKLAQNNKCVADKYVPGPSNTYCRTSCNAPTEVPTCGRDAGVSCEAGTQCTAFSAKSAYFAICK